MINGRRRKRKQASTYLQKRSRARKRLSRRRRRYERERSMFVSMSEALHLWRLEIEERRPGFNKARGVAKLKRLGLSQEEAEKYVDAAQRLTGETPYAPLPLSLFSPAFKGGSFGGTNETYGTSDDRLCFLRNYGSGLPIHYRVDF